MVNKMNDRCEVIVTSDSSGINWTACIWDSHTGTSLMSYKGGDTANSHCMSLVGNDYLLCAPKSKPLIYVWPLNSQEISNTIPRIVAPGCVSALSVSPNCDYCVVGIKEKVYVWDLLGGNLIHVPARHFRAISCIKFTDDGSHFVSGGEDGMVIVWSIAYLVAGYANEFLRQSEVGQQEPKYTLSHHTLPVTDLYVGHGGVQALLVSVSGDHTCKIYNLSDGTLLLSVILNCALSAVTMNVNESEIFVGAVNGEIYSFDIQPMPRTLNHHLAKKEEKNKYTGHKKVITCLSTSLDGFRLLSGSADETVIIWDIMSKQCLKVLKHNGTITNAYFTFCPKHVFSSVFQPSSVITNFKKSQAKRTIKMIKKESFEENDKLLKVKVSEKQHIPADGSTELKLKEINKKLYMFTVNKILQTSEDIRKLE